MGEFRFNINVDGCEELASALKTASSVRFQGVAKITAKEIYNRAVDGGTPVDTGELRQSLFLEISGEKASVGYTKDYAPHVEFGHRTKNGGYVAGQHYLQRNVETQRPLYKKLLMDNLKKVLK